MASPASARASWRRHTQSCAKKGYTNILYLTYSGSLKRDIAGLDFADDLENDDEDERFRKHNRFLRTLKDDTLLIIDNFNATSTQDEILSIVLKYRCRVLFTTRSSLPGQTCFLLEEIQDREALFKLAAMFYTHADKHRAILEEIIEVLHRHTLAIELAARLLETGMMKPKAVLEKLIEERASFDASDNHARTTTYSSIPVTTDSPFLSRGCLYPLYSIHAQFALNELSPVSL